MANPEARQLDSLPPKTYLELASLGTGIDFNKERSKNLEGERPEVAGHVRMLTQTIFGLSPSELRKRATETSPDLRKLNAAKDLPTVGDDHQINTLTSDAFTENGAEISGSWKIPLVKEPSQTSDKAYRRRLRARERTALSVKLIDQLRFLDKFKDREKLSALSALGTTANDFVNWARGRYFPGEIEFGMRNKVEMCNDPGELILLAFDDTQSEIIKFEAARKLFLMISLGEIQSYSQPEIDHEGALREMLAFFDERIVKVPQGKRTGDTVDKDIVSYHHKADYGTKRTMIVDSEKEIKEDTNNPDEIKRVTHIELKTADIPNANGETREVRFMMHSRDKSLFSRLLKALRYGAVIGEKDVDRNGIQMVFENEADWEDTFNFILQQQIVNIVENLELQLSECDEYNKYHDLREKIKLLKAAKLIKVVNGKGEVRGMYLSNEPREEAEPLVDVFDQGTEEEQEKEIKNFFQCFVAKKDGQKPRKIPSKYAHKVAYVNPALAIYEFKNSMNGEGFKGNGKGSSKGYKTCKFKMEVMGENNRVCHYEYQVFGLAGYLDGIYKKGEGWEEYDINRFFEENVDELLFPEHIYNKTDRQKVREKLLRNTHRKNWNGHSA